MNNCKDCGHWDKNGETLGVVDGFDGNTGLCMLISTSEYGLNNLAESSKAEAICMNEGVGGELICSPYFGCIEWVKKDV